MSCYTASVEFFVQHVTTISFAFMFFQIHIKRKPVHSPTTWKRGCWGGGPIWSYDQLWSSNVMDTLLTGVCVNSKRQCATVW